MINKIQALISTHLMIQGSEENSEELAQVHVVGRLFESEPTAVVQVHREFSWKSFAKDLHWRRHLFLADLQWSTVEF